MDAYVSAARNAQSADPIRLARIAYNKRMYGAVYSPAIEAEVYAATKALNPR